MNPAPQTAAVSEMLARRTREQELLKQIKALDYHDWRPTIPFGAPHRSDDEIQSEAESSPFRYLPFFDDARGIGQYRFLLTCDALGIPRERWPSFGTVILPNPMRFDVEMPPFVPPRFDVVRKASSMELRLKWAVLHRCKGWSYARLHNSPRYNPGKKHTEDAITRATQRVLDELGLRERS